jgi:transposase InsO family protein
MHASGLYIFGEETHVTKMDFPLRSSPANASPVVGDQAYLARAYTEKSALMEWHIRLGHRSFSDVAQFLRQRGIAFATPRKPPFCKACVLAKSSRYPTRHNVVRYRAPRPGHTLHTDNCGPFTVPTRGGGNRYFNVMVDCFSNRIWVHLMASQSEFLDYFKELVAQIEAQMGSTRVVSQLHADGFSSFEKSQALRQFCAQMGIQPTYSPPGTPRLNAVAERTIRTLCEMARAMMIDSAVPASLWGEALVYSAWILNCLPSRHGSADTRFSLFLSRDPPTSAPSRIMPFGCLC